VRKSELTREKQRLLWEVIDIDEYIDFLSSEELRKHIQPNITDTTIY